MLMRNQHLHMSPVIEVFMVTADYYYPDWECLVDFLCNPGLKNCWHGQPGIEPTTLDLSQVPMTSQPRYRFFSLLGKAFSKIPYYPTETHSIGHLIRALIQLSWTSKLPGIIIVNFPYMKFISWINSYPNIFKWIKFCWHIFPISPIFFFVILLIFTFCCVQLCRLTRYNQIDENSIMQI